MAPHPTSSPRRTLRPAVAAPPAGVCALAMSACGASGEPDASAHAGAATTTRVTDATGTAVKVPSAPERVVALSQMDLHAALTLGGQPVGLTAGRGQKGAPGHLAVRAKGVPVVGAVAGPDIEKAVQADPDVILAGRLADEQVLQQVRKSAPPVVTIDSGEDWTKSLTLTGKALVGEPAKEPAYQRLKAVRAGQATVVDGAKWTSPGGAQAAVSVLDDIRKATVK
ncbi:ABC transporter substrate-binding protein [Streptomyces sp. A1277]|uniref:ABC transporter substrate-binding protein n=1 Tax=Streptomyces sp. A1277 TaxID=2563103 RepID=UPI0010A28077|nr:ABC transporter substrate-binding protein [Streptomyces sp. A1277]THA30236.1 ABC transporter substrate-binding protein [Streptomyces sp. A1277]